MNLLELKRVTADAECFHDVQPPYSFGKSEFLGNAVTCTLANGVEYKDWILDQGIMPFWAYCLQFQLLITYNGPAFDYPLWGGSMLGPEHHNARKFFEKSFKGRTVDLLQDFRDTLGKKVRLADVAVPTLGDAKEMDGGYAPQHWRAGRCFEVIEYCRGDVRRTDKLFEIAASGGPLKVQLKDGETREFTCSPKLR